MLDVHPPPSPPFPSVPLRSCAKQLCPLCTPSCPLWLERNGWFSQRALQFFICVNLRHLRLKNPRFVCVSSVAKKSIGGRDDAATFPLQFFICVNLRHLRLKKSAFHPRFIRGQKIHRRQGRRRLLNGAWGHAPSILGYWIFLVGYWIFISPPPLSPRLRISGPPAFFACNGGAESVTFSTSRRSGYRRDLFFGVPWAGAVALSRRLHYFAKMFCTYCTKHSVENGQKFFKPEV